MYFFHLTCWLHVGEVTSFSPSRSLTQSLRHTSDHRYQTKQISKTDIVTGICKGAVFIHISSTQTDQLKWSNCAALKTLNNQMKQIIIMWPLSPSPPPTHTISLSILHPSNDSLQSVAVQSGAIDIACLFPHLAATDKNLQGGCWVIVSPAYKAGGHNAFWRRGLPRSHSQLHSIVVFLLSLCLALSLSFPPSHSLHLCRSFVSSPLAMYFALFVSLSLTTCRGLS